MMQGTHIGTALTTARKTGIAIICGFALAALLAPWISPYAPTQTGIPFQAPSLLHPLGTNDVGGDVLSEVIHSARVSLPIGLFAGFFSLAVGVLVGVVSGLYRGIVGGLLMALTDVFILIPGLPLLIVLAAYVGPGFWNMIGVIGALWWTSTARVVHARALQAGQMQYVLSARALGYSNLHLIRRHVLPNMTDLIRARFAVSVATAMLTETSLSFIGLGDPQHVSWGQMIHFAFERGGFAKNMWWWYLPPGLAICICVLGFVMLGMDRRRRNPSVVSI
jgi:peptide/nickel transport system permease protein